MATKAVKKSKKAAPKVGASRFRTIRVTSDVYDLVHKVVGDVSSQGWQHFGVERRDAASITTVVAEAITRLAELALTR